MDKFNFKKIGLFLVLLVLTVLLLFLLGQGNGSTSIVGDINLIDEGQYAAWVNNIFHGQVIYRDFYVQYGPLMVFPYYISAKIFGFSFLSFRIWNAFQIGLSILIMISILKDLKVRKIFITIVYVVLIIIPGLNIRYLFGILVVYFYFKKNKVKKLDYKIVSGLLLATSFFMSIEVAIFTLISVVAFEIVRILYVKNIKKELLDLGKFIFVFFLGFLIFAFIFSKLGFLNSYLLITKEFIFSLSGSNLPNGYGLPEIILSINNPLQFIKSVASRYTIFYVSFILLTISFAFVFVRYTLRKEYSGFFVTTSFYVLLIYFSIIGRSGHYFNVFPLFFFIFAYIADVLYSFSKRHNLKFFKIFLFIAFFTYALRHIYFYVKPEINILSLYKQDVKIARVYPLKISRSQSEDIKLLQLFVNKNIKPNEKIYFLNNMPGMYFLVDRRNSVRYDLPLLAGTLEKRLEIVEGLKKSKPKFILEDLTSWDVDGVSDRRRMPEVFEYVEMEYRYKKNIGRYRIYSLHPF